MDDVLLIQPLHESLVIIWLGLTLKIQAWAICNKKCDAAVFALSEKCPNTEFFLFHVFSHSDWIRRDTEYLSAFSPNAGKYGPEETPYLDISRSVASALRRNFSQSSHPFLIAVAVLFCLCYFSIAASMWI